MRSRLGLVGRVEHRLVSIHRVRRNNLPCALSVPDKCIAEWPNLDGRIVWLSSTAAGVSISRSSAARDASATSARSVNGPFRHEIIVARQIGRVDAE
ncbi:MAG TPA: hypothetical protein VLN49_23165 [Gemmatimonadaceae bacterium]|nr:hypothetical protein [Gemmatimonadaceae bacterium]